MPVKRNAPAKNIIFWVAAGAVIILLWSLLQTPTIIKSATTIRIRPVAVKKSGFR